MKEFMRGCVVCEKKIVVVEDKMGNGGHTAHKTKMFFRRTSEEGVFFCMSHNSGKWFCNKCWEQVRK